MDREGATLHCRQASTNFQQHLNGFYKHLVAPVQQQRTVFGVPLGLIVFGRNRKLCLNFNTDILAAYGYYWMASMHRKTFMVQQLKVKIHCGFSRSRRRYVLK